MAIDKSVQIAGIPVAADQYIRLQCVQLVHRPDKDEQTIIDRAEKLASYVISGTAKPTAVPGSRPSPRIAKAGMGRPPRSTMDSA